MQPTNAVTTRRQVAAVLGAALIAATLIAAHRLASPPRPQGMAPTAIPTMAAAPTAPTAPARDAVGLAAVWAPGGEALTLPPGAEIVPVGRCVTAPLLVQVEVDGDARVWMPRVDAGVTEDAQRALPPAGGDCADPTPTPAPRVQAAPDPAPAPVWVPAPAPAPATAPPPPALTNTPAPLATAAPTAQPTYEPGWGESGSAGGSWDD